MLNSRHLTVLAESLMHCIEVEKKNNQNIAKLIISLEDEQERLVAENANSKLDAESQEIMKIAHESLYFSDEYLAKLKGARTKVVSALTQSNFLLRKMRRFDRLEKKYELLSATTASAISK